VVDVLRRVPLLAALLDEEVAWLAAGAEVLDVAAGSVLVAEGTEADRVYLVLEGRAVLLFGAAPIATVGPGELVGALGVVASVPRSTSAVAQTPMVVAGLGARRLWELLDHPATAARLTARPSAGPTPQFRRNPLATPDSYGPSGLSGRSWR
jgi:CRP-like cAMP-binding protein